MKSLTKRYLKPGDTARIEIAFSEVCMYMHVAGRLMNVRVVGNDYPMAQLLNDDGQPFSAPVTLGEAGLYQDENGIYCYPETDQRTEQIARGFDPRAVDAVIRRFGDEATEIFAKWEHATLAGCYMFPHQGMWFGCEYDGYIHT